MSIYQAACNVNTHTRKGDCLPIYYQIVTENWKMCYLCWYLITYNIKNPIHAKNNDTSKI